MRHKVASYAVVRIVEKNPHNDSGIRLSENQFLDKEDPKLRRIKGRKQLVMKNGESSFSGRGLYHITSARI